MIELIHEAKARRPDDRSRVAAHLAGTEVLQAEQRAAFPLLEQSNSMGRFRYDVADRPEADFQDNDVKISNQKPYLAKSS